MLKFNEARKFLIEKRLLQKRKRLYYEKKEDFYIIPKNKIKLRKHICTDYEVKEIIKLKFLGYSFNKIALKLTIA